MKRSLSPGYAGVDHPLLHADGTMMLFGEAGDVLQSISAAMALF